MGKKSWASLLTTLFLLLLPGTSTGAETLRIATGEYVPFCSSSAYQQGFTSHVVREAFARQGYRVEFDFLAWNRALSQTAEGRYDATSWWVYSDERAKSFLFSNELVKTSVHFFYVKSRNFDFNWSSVDDLLGYQIGVTKGYHYSDALLAFKRQNPKLFRQQENDEKNFRQLLRGNIDLFPINSVVGLELLRTRFAPTTIHQVGFHPRPLSNNSGFLLFPKKNARSDELLKIFNEGLESLRVDGSYDRMVDDLLSGRYSN